MTGTNQTYDEETIAYYVIYLHKQYNNMPYKPNFKEAYHALKVEYEATETDSKEAYIRYAQEITNDNRTI